MTQSIGMQIHHRARWSILVVALTATSLATFPVSSAFAQAPVAAASTEPALTPEELETLVGRIALYPDDLIAVTTEAGYDDHSSYPASVL